MKIWKNIPGCGKDSGEVQKPWGKNGQEALRDETERERRLM